LPIEHERGVPGPFERLVGVRSRSGL